MKKISFFVFVFVSFLALNVSAAIIDVSIPLHQKNLRLDPGAIYQFTADVYDDALGRLENVALDWRLQDLNGFDTTVPGLIDNQGILHLAPFYQGRFKVFVREPASGLFDEAIVETKDYGNNPPGQDVWSVQVSPYHLALPWGASAQLYVNCYDRYGYLYPRCTLRYYVTDGFGYRIPNGVYISNGAVLYTQYLRRGRYYVHFEAVNGPGRTTISLDIY